MTLILPRVHGRDFERDWKRPLEEADELNIKSDRNGQINGNLTAGLLDKGGAAYSTRGASIAPDCDGTTGSGTDHTSALNAFFAARSTGDVVLISHGGGLGYRVTGVVTVPRGVNVIQDAPIYDDSGTNTVALVIGVAGSANSAVRFVGLEVVRVTQSDWTNEACVGVRIINPLACDITVRRASGFTIGVQIRGDGEGASYNEITLQRISNNKYGLDLDAINSGWVNENNFYGGEFACFSGIGTGLARYGIRLTSSDATYLTLNNNVFHKPSFEINQTVAGAAEALPVLIEHGIQNAFLSARDETGGDYFAREENASQANIFDLGYGIVAVDRQSTYPSSIASDRVSAVLREGAVVFDSGPVHKAACYADGATNINVPRVHIAASSNASIFSSLDALTLNAAYLSLAASRGLAILVDTVRAKRFVVRKDVEASFGGRVAIRCYDSSGTVLTSVGGGHPYVRTQESSAVSFSTDFGGVYQTGSDADGAFFFEVGDDVKQVAVILTGGTAALRIRSFQVLGIETLAAACSTGYEEIVPGCNIGTAAPTAGTWARGRRVYNATPAASGTEGWICVTAGTPGTWKTFGTIAA